MPIKITPIKKKKKDQSKVKGQGQSHPTRGDVTQVRTGKKSSGVADGSFGHGVFIKDKDKPRKKASGGKLKSVPEGKKGLSKLPTPVRNKMGFMKKGGMLNKKGKK